MRRRIRLRIERIVLFWRIHRDAYTLFFTLERLERNLGAHLRHLNREGITIPPDLAHIREQMARPVRRILTPD